MQYLQIKKWNKAVAKKEYTATELDTCLGDELFLHYELNDSEYRGMRVHAYFFYPSCELWVQNFSYPDNFSLCLPAPLPSLVHKCAYIYRPKHP
jgi:hypothetical protein